MGLSNKFTEEQLDEIQKMLQFIFISACYGRLGAIGCAKILNEISGEYLPAYEKYEGYDSRTAMDDAIKMRLPVRNSPVEYNIKYGGAEEEANADIMNRLQYRDNKTEYDYKKPRRMEGLLFKQALDYPVINLSQNYSGGACPLPLDQFSEEEQKLIRNDAPIAEETKTVSDHVNANLQKTDEPYNRNVMMSQMEFFDKDGGRYFKGLHPDMYSITPEGSSVVADKYYEINGGKDQPVGDRSMESLYNQQMGDKTVSNVNIRQQANFKSRQQLGKFSGVPTEQRLSDKEKAEQIILQGMDSRHSGGRHPYRRF